MEARFMPFRSINYHRGGRLRSGVDNRGRSVQQNQHLPDQVPQSLPPSFGWARLPIDSGGVVH